MKTFDGKTVFLTGAASGIGRALALQLAARGCRLYLVDIDGDALRSLIRQPAFAGCEVWTDVSDLSQCDSARASAERALEQTDGIDLLINNAGVAYYGQTDEMSRQQWQRIMGVNLLAPIEITQVLLPSLLNRPDTHLVNMCSISGLVAGGRFAAYHTSKFGLVGFTESLRAEYGRRGLGVTAICPGPVQTGLYQATVTSRPDRRAPNPPRWMCATPERVAELTIRAILKNRRQLLITPTAHVLFQLKRFLPGLIDFASQFSRNRKKRQRLLQERLAQQQASRQPNKTGSAMAPDRAA